MTTDEKKKEEARRARERYHNDPEYRARKKAKMCEWTKANKGYYKKRDSTPERKAQKARAQARYRRKMKSLGLYKFHRGDRTAQTKRWLSKPENKIKRDAHLKVFEAIKKSLLKKLPCEVCNIFPAHAHHDDYNKPLDVRWLCTRHHYEHHKSMLPSTLDVV